MTRDEHGPLSETARAELAAIDAALRGEPVTADHCELGELALLLRDDRPRPEEQFAARFDERVGHGFTPAPGDAGPPARAPHADGAGVRRRRATRSLWPAVAVIDHGDRCHRGGTGVRWPARWWPARVSRAGGSCGGRHRVARGPTGHRPTGSPQIRERRRRRGPVVTLVRGPSGGSDATLNVGVAHARFAVGRPAGLLDHQLLPRLRAAVEQRPRAANSRAARAFSCACRAPARRARSRRSHSSVACCLRPTRPTT